MLTYLIVSTSHFTRGLKKLSGIDKERAQKVIEELVVDPYSYKELAGKFKEIRSASSSIKVRCEFSKLQSAVYSREKAPRPSVLL